MAIFLKIFLRWILGILVSVFIFWIFVANYSFVFKKKIVGEVQSVEAMPIQALVTAQSSTPLNAQIFSVAVAIKDLSSQEIHMASSEDRQWMAVQKGNCVIAAFFPYPPWNFQKGTTNHNARLLKNFSSCETLTKEPDSIWEKVKFFFLWL